MKSALSGRLWLFLLLVGVLPGLCVVAAAAEKAPVLVYTFEKGGDGIVCDATGNGHHAAVQGKEQYVKGPTGPAFAFDGATSLAARTSHKLVMSNELTLDVWLRIDKPGAQGCVIDKGGERYRIAVTSNGGFFFGLKHGKKRADFHGPKLTVGEWHRITATFKRPVMTIYLDRKKTGTRKWDSDAGPGSTLYIGAKARKYNFFRGAVDQVRIYDYARAPMAGDEKLTFGPGATTGKKGLAMKESRGVVHVDTGAIQFDLDTKRGVVRALAAGDKRVIADNTEPPLFATLMESADYNGVTDLCARKFVKARYTCGGLKATKKVNVFTATGKGALVFTGGDAIDFDLTFRAEEGSRRLGLKVALRKRGAFRNRFIREIGLRQPLALNRRKRVVQAGDQGLRWDTRCEYQFHMHTDFAATPDFNYWRHFYVDQATDHSYSIWRAESPHTSGLYAFRGRRAPGWMTLYDAEGGALFAYRDLSARAPKCLSANGDGGGEGVVYLHAPTQAALALNDPRAATSVFGKAHALDWIFFKGEEAIERPDGELAKAWGVKALASDGPPSHQPVADELDLWNAPAPTGDAAPLVAGGMPLPRGAITKPGQARLFVRGKETPAQANILAYWPDRSIKWLLLIFPLDGKGGYRFTPGAGEGDEATFRVTLRKGKPVPCTLRFGKGVRAGKITSPLRVGRSGGAVAVNTGRLSLKLTTGERWLASAALDGREMLRADGRPQAYVDFLRMRKDYVVGATHPKGTPDAGPVHITKIAVEEEGPLRTVIRLEGSALAKEPPRVVLRVEAYAGRPHVRLFHSVEFTQKDPRRVFVRRLGLHLPLALNKSGRRLAVGGQKGVVALKPAALTGLRQTSHLNYEVWQADKGRAYREVRESNHCSRGWLDVADGRRGLAVAVRDMWQDFPKELIFDDGASAIEVGLWPASSPLMDVRRYSNYPHRAQGESVPWDTRWVEESYYQRDPFAGVSKSHELFLLFHDGDTGPDAVDGANADFQSRPLVYAGYPWYRRTAITLPLLDPGADAYKRTSANLANLADWWLFHQKIWGWYGHWDYGDLRHLFRGGYGRIFRPQTLAKIMKMPKRERAKINLRRMGYEYDYFTQNDWAFDNGRWGWSNTEGLPNLFMSNEYLRNGRRDLFFFMEANVRHVRDVDARHSGRWFGAGTRHGVQHWSDGNHEPRQTTFAEQRIHYLLSGEHRTREWNKQLSDESYLKGKCTVHAHHSGRSYGLLTRWEITGDPELGEIFRNYMHCFAQPQGIDIAPTVAFPSGTRVGKARDINGASMFFYTFGGMHALLEYYYLTEDARVRDAIIKTADFAVGKGMRAANGMQRKAVAFAARYSATPEKYRKILRAWAVSSRGGRYVFQQVSVNRAHWTGETAFLVGNVPGGMFWANDAHYVLGALGREPTPTKALEAEFKAREDRPGPRESRLPRGSWQTEYDRPEFEKYLRDPLKP